jgi:hypothetical protein
MRYSHKRKLERAISVFRTSAEHANNIELRSS